MHEKTSYGLFNHQGIGELSSWRKYLTSLCEEEQEGKFYGKWHGLFRDSFLEREVFDAIYDRMVSLLDSCPEERSLVHGYCGGGHVVVQDGKIAGILDWIDSFYGDFVYDIASLDFWMPRLQLPDRFQHYYATKGMQCPPSQSGCAATSAIWLCPPFASLPNFIIATATTGHASAYSISSGEAVQCVMV